LESNFSLIPIRTQLVHSLEQIDIVAKLRKTYKFTVYAFLYEFLVIDDFSLHIFASSLINLRLLFPLMTKHIYENICVQEN